MPDLVYYFGFWPTLLAYSFGLLFWPALLAYYFGLFFWPTLCDLKLCIHRCMFEYTAGLGQLLQALCRMFSLFIDSRQNEYSEVYKMTEAMAWESDIGPKAQWEADHGKQRGSRHPRNKLATLSTPTTRLSAITGKARPEAPIQ